MSSNGYQVVNLKRLMQSFSLEKVLNGFSRIKPTELVLFYRQLALLLGSGIDIITSLELLQGQTSSRPLMLILGEVISDLRSGAQLSAALGKHPDTFSTTSCRLLRIGEETGNFEIALRHIADYMEKEINSSKGIKSAMLYPVIAIVVTIIVVGILLTFVLPAFGDLYNSIGAKLPTMTRILIDAGNKLKSMGIYIILIIFLSVVSVFSYIKTPQGRYRWDKLTLGLPLIGRVSHLRELGRICRNIALLFQAGLPITEVIHLTAQASGNRVISNALIKVQQDILKGEGLSRPMKKNPIFLPMMVHMVKVGEETGNLDTNLMAVAQTYETEAEDKMKTLIGLIQPTMTLVMALIVGLIALSLTSAMYSIYGQGL